MQAALAYAHERKQGRATGASAGPSPIIAHPDVKRMLITMRAPARRALCYATAVALDRAQRSTDERSVRRRA
jgi:alkylation response protein AidB-like acyl-CoA dehydrogenase